LGLVRQGHRWALKKARRGAPLKIEEARIYLLIMKHQFTLKTGEVIQVSDEGDGPLGVEGYRLHITSLRSTLLVVPSSSNTIEVATPKAFAAEAREVEQIVVDRQRARQRSHGSGPRPAE
jgi:hypothetical protein